MDWKQLFTYITGSVDQELLLHNEYLVTETGSSANSSRAVPGLVMVNLVATDFFTADIWTTCGLVIDYILFFIHLVSRKVHIAGVIPHPNQRWMMQIARTVTMADWGVLSPEHYLIHDRDGKYCPAFQRIIDDAGVTRVLLTPRSQNLNAYAACWVRAVKEEALSCGASCLGSVP